MAFVIRANSLFVKRVLKVHPDCVVHYESAFIGGRKKHTFHQIQCVLMSAENVLSYQVGNDVFKIPTKPHKHKHQEAVQALLDGVRAAHRPPPVPAG